MKQSDLKWFHDQLRFELEDRELEKQGVSLEFYWDTTHAVWAVLGMAVFYDEADRFLHDRFYSDQALVSALASKGWFGQIKLLQPHEAEFLKLLDSEFEVGPVGPPHGGLSRLIADTKLKGIPSVPSSELVHLTETEITGIVRAQAGNASTLFKVIYCGVGTWKTRIWRWKRDRLFAPSTEVVPYGPMMASEEFQKLRNAFDDQRQNSRLNNFADAMAICILAAQVSEFNEGHSNKVPRFCVSSDLYEKVLSTTQLTHIVEVGEGFNKRSVLRHFDYFKVRAMFHIPDDLREALPDGIQHSGTTSDEALKETLGRVRGILDAQKPLADARFSIDDDSLEGQIKDLKNFYFLDSVWLPFAASTQIRAEIKEYLDTARLLRTNESFKEEVEKELQSAKDALAKSTEDFQRIGKFLKLVQDASKALRKRFETVDPQSNLFRLFGLIRFGFPAAHRATVETLLQQIIEGGASCNAALNRLLGCWQSIRNNQADLSDLSIFACLLWCLRIDRILVQVLGDGGYEQHYSVAMMVAAARLRMMRDSNQVSAAIKRLTKHYEKVASRNERIDLAIGLAYLNFHYWRFSKLMRMLSGPTDSDTLLESAIAFATTALSACEDAKDWERHCYALNNRVYYLLHGPGQLDWGEIAKAAYRLVDESNNQEVWQYRFDDTLASFFEKHYTITAGHDKQRDRDNALYYMERAWESCYNDEEIAQHRTQLQLKFGEMHASS
jgi:hypothetical protein